MKNSFKAETWKSKLNPNIKIPQNYALSFFSVVQWCCACWYYEMAWYQIFSTDNIQHYNFFFFTFFFSSSRNILSKDFLDLPKTLSWMLFDSWERTLGLPIFPLFSRWQSRRFLFQFPITNNSSLFMHLATRECKIKGATVSLAFL